jgi:hypothetical protein
MLDAPRDVGDTVASVALVPGAIELLGRCPKLYEEIARQVLRFSLAPFLAP